METADARRLIVAVEKSANALERIAAALEAANKADPLQMIAEAMAMEENQPVNVDAQLADVGIGPLDFESWRLK